MRIKSVTPIAVAIVALAVAAVTPAFAQSYNDSCGQPQSWAQRIGSGWMSPLSGASNWQAQAPGWQQSNSTLGNLWNQVRGNISPNSGNYAYPYLNGQTTASYYPGSYPYANNNGYGNVDPDFLYRQTDRLNREAIKIQNKLNSRKLSAEQISRLQTRLAQIDAERAALNNTASTQLTGVRDYLQQMLSSGSLNNQNQAYYAQDRISQINGLLAQLGTGSSGVLGNSGLLGSLRSLLGF